eukprot:gene25359-30620_t
MEASRRDQSQDLEMARAESKSGTNGDEEEDRISISRISHLSMSNLAQVLVGSSNSATSSLRLPSLDKIIGFRRHMDVSEGQREHSWLFHLLDIIYVATVYRINALMAACGSSAEVYAYTGSLFVLMFLSRYNFDQYKCTFQSKGFVHTLIFLLYCLCVLVMTLNIAVDYSGEAHHRRLDGDSADLGSHCHHVTLYDHGLALGYVLSRLLLCALYGTYAFFLHKQVADHSRTIAQIALAKLLPYAAGCALMLSALGAGQLSVVLPVAAAVELVAQFAPEFVVRLDFILPDTQQLDERLGLFFMLILGEGVLGLLIQKFDTSQTQPVYETLLACVIVIFVLGFQFFNRTIKYMGRAHAKDAASAGDGSGGCNSPFLHPLQRPRACALYVLCVMCMSFSMMIVQDGMVEIFRDVDGQLALDHHHGQTVREKIAVGLCSVWLCMVGLRLLDDEYRSNLALAFAAHLTAEQRDSFHGSSHSALESSPRSLLAALLIKLLVAALHVACLGLHASLKDYVGIQCALTVLPLLCELLFDLLAFLRAHSRPHTAKGEAGAELQVLSEMFRASNMAQDLHVGAGGGGSGVRKRGSAPEKSAADEAFVVSQLHQQQL